MLYVTHVAGHCQPVVRCHACDKRIHDVADGVVVYPSGLEDGQTVRAVVAHHGECFEKVAAALENEHGAPNVLELDDYLARMRQASEVAC